MHTDELMVNRGSRFRWAGMLLAASCLALVLRPGVLRAQGAPSDTVTLSWTAPGDDGNVGTAASYDMRMSQSDITEANWNSASPVPGAPDPLPAGTRQRMVVRGLTYGVTYYFAIKSVDDAGNWSGISNVVVWNWTYDTAPPAAPGGLAALVESGGGVRLTWSANSEPDLAGYTVYRALAAGGPFVALNASLITTNTYLDSSLPREAGAAWYQITASDNTGNESARSATTSVSLAGDGGSWAVEPGYPNPSHSGTPVNIPIVVPGFGGTARIEIVNSIGQLVRRLDPGALGGGPQTILWDGRNEAGLEVAPGAYTAWLVAGSTRIGIRLVRVP